MKAHFITLLYPGSFFSEETKLPISAWDLSLALELVSSMNKDRPPYAFFFTTRERGENDLDSKQTDRSGLYYIGGKVRTKEEILAGADPEEKTLRSNMQDNPYIGVVERNGRAHPLMAGDRVLEA